MDHDRLSAVRGILADIRASGGRVRIGGEDLQVQGELEPDLLEQLHEHKTSLIEHLRHPPTWPCASCGKHLFPTPKVTCFWCRAKEEGEPDRPDSPSGAKDAPLVPTLQNNGR